MQMTATNDKHQIGTVIAHHGKAIAIEDSTGELFRCTSRRRMERPVCGDQVQWRPTGGGRGLIHQVLPRRNLMSRPDRSGATHALAANLDRLIIVLAPKPAFQESLIDRYLVAAEYFGIPPLLLLNKTDLPTTDELAILMGVLSHYTKLGYPLCQSSTKKEDGLEQLLQHLDHGASVLVGQSGVGKSSLIKRLLPEIQIAVDSTDKEFRQGRHVTSATTLYHLPDGGNIMDSPGTRDFALWHIPEEHIAWGYVEFKDYLGNCRFRDCRHLKEPGCVLREAVEEGQVQRRRFESYHAVMAGMADQKR